MNPDNDRMPGVIVHVMCTCMISIHYQSTTWHFYAKVQRCIPMYLETEVKWCTNLTNMTITSFSNVFLNVFLYHCFPFRSAFLTEQRGRFVAPFFHTWVRRIFKRIVGQIEFILIYVLGNLSKQQVIISQQQNTCMYV